MNDRPHNFRKASVSAIADEVLGAVIRKTTDVFISRRAASIAELAGFEDLRDWGRSCKLEVSGRLEEYALQFANRLEAAGAIVHFAHDAAEAADIAEGIAVKRGARTAVKSKSMTAEEISLNDALLQAGVTVTETDLGEFIIQIAGEKPSHILAPAIHKDRNQVAQLFHRILGTPPGLDVESLVSAARKTLRDRFLAAEIGITGANFAVAETGTLVIVTNEGNGRMTTTLPRVQIAILGIDKIIPRISDLPGFLTLLTRSATGQTISSYVTIITGPRKPGEEEGPEQLHVVLLDNGRSPLASGPFREILHCLHCGACLNHCPVYRAVGGHAYESVYPGPMGDVLSPVLWGMKAYPDLPDACTLCGRCAEACPVRIPLPEYHRKLRILRAEGQTQWTAGVSAAVAANPLLYRANLGLLRQILAHHKGLLNGRTGGILEAWTTCRELPRPKAGPSFRALWHDRERGRL